MNAIYLHKPDGTETKWSMCSECGTVASPGNFDISQKCCTCYECGELLPKDQRVKWATKGGYALRHDACEKARRARVDAEALEKAELVTDYDGPVYFEGRTGSYGDGYFGNVEELADALAGELMPEDGPQYAFCCEERAFGISLDNVIETVLEDMDDTAWDRLAGTEELEEAVRTFNEVNKGVISYYEDRKRKVVIPTRRPNAD